MIVEIPHPGCVPTSSPLYSKIPAARSAFNAKYTPTTSEPHAVTFFCSGYNC